MSDPVHRRRMEELFRECRARGVPLTVQRRAILSALVARADHPTAEDLHADIATSMPEVSRGTVYRTLDTLVELGLVGRVSHPGSAARFDARTDRHHHMVCDRCGSMTDLEAPSLDVLPVPDLSSTGFSVRDYSVLIRGFCRECADAQRGAEAGSEDP